MYVQGITILIELTYGYWKHYSLNIFKLMLVNNKLTPCHTRSERGIKSLLTTNSQSEFPVQFVEN